MINYRDFETTDAETVSKLILSSFEEFVAYDYSQNGIDEFTKYIVPEALNIRLNNNHFSLVAETSGRVVGIIEIRGWNHISLFFVDKDFHNQGIAHTLWTKALNRCQKYNHEQKYTVNSSKFALPIYQKLGFVKIGEYQIKNGIGFIPMLRSNSV